MKSLVLRLTTIALVLFATWSPGYADPLFKKDADVVAAVMPAFVNVYTRSVVTVVKGKDEASGTPPSIRDGVGSGFIIDPKGLIVTNRHVIDGAYSVFVTLSDGTHVPAKLVGKGLTFDLALIKIDVGHALPVVKMGDSDKLRIGDKVIAIGNAQEFPSSVSVGVVSALHRQVGLSTYDDLIQTDATINRGNSGGPLINEAGEVVGINQAIYTQNRGGSIGIGFSMPVNQAKFFLHNIKKYGKPHIGWLGVTGQTVTPGMAASLGLPAGGVILSDIRPDGSAVDARLQVGDVIAKVGDYKISDIPSLNKAVAVSVDQTVRAQIFRDGKPMTISIKIEEWPNALWRSTLEDPPSIRSLADIGIKASDRPMHDSVSIDTVAENSVAWTAGMRAGDVVRNIQGRDVHSVEEAGEIARELRSQGKDSAVILLDGPMGARWIELSIRE